MTQAQQPTCECVTTCGDCRKLGDKCGGYKDVAAAPQAVQPALPLPLLVRDIARDLGITVPQACIALKPLGNYSTNSAVTAEMARMLRAHLRAAPAHPAEAVPAAQTDLALSRACDLLSMTVITLMGFRETVGYTDNSPIAGLVSDAVEFLQPWPEKRPTATQPAAQGLDAASVVRHLAIGRAIERVCVELPEGAEISISLEKGAGTITLIDWDGNEQENFPTDDGFAGTLNAAVDTAIADEAAIAAQAKQGGA